MDIRFVATSLTVHLEIMDGISDEAFKKEYRILSDFEEDAVGQWLKLARARGETSDSDEILLRLMVELHKKVDTLTDEYAILEDWIDATPTIIYYK